MNSIIIYNNNPFPDIKQFTFLNLLSQYYFIYLSEQILMSYLRNWWIFCHISLYFPHFLQIRLVIKPFILRQNIYYAFYSYVYMHFRLQQKYNFYPLLIGITITLRNIHWFTIFKTIYIDKQTKNIYTYFCVCKKTDLQRIFVN